MSVGQTGGQSGRQSGGQTGGQMLLHVYLRYFFPRISCRRQLQLLRYSCLVLSCCVVGNFSLFKWRTCAVIRPSDRLALTGFTPVWFSNNAVLITTSRGGSAPERNFTPETFTQRKIAFHANSSVNGAAVEYVSGRAHLAFKGRPSVSFMFLFAPRLSTV